MSSKNLSDAKPLPPITPDPQLNTDLTENVDVHSESDTEIILERPTSRQSEAGSVASAGN